MVRCREVVPAQIRTRHIPVERVFRDAVPAAVTDDAAVPDAVIGAPLYSEAVAESSLE